LRKNFVQKKCHGKRRVWEENIGTVEGKVIKGARRVIEGGSKIKVPDWFLWCFKRDA